jgi:hypothetical protein
MDDRTLDRHLGAVYDELVSAIYLTKQVVWSASSAQRNRLQGLLGFLIEQSHAVDEAEARLGGRAVGMASPSGHPRANLLGEVHNDVQAAFAVYTKRLMDLVGDLRRRAATIGDADEATLLVDTASGLETRLADLERST